MVRTSDSLAAAEWLQVTSSVEWPATEMSETGSVCVSSDRKAFMSSAGLCMVYNFTLLKVFRVDVAA